MKRADFEFQLPEELIALRPTPEREGARLLVVHPDGRLEHRQFRDLVDYLNPQDILVVNDSRVLPAQLLGTRLPRQEGGPSARIALTLHTRSGPDRYRAFARPARRLQAGDRLVLGEGLTASVEERADAEIALKFDLAGAALDRRLEREGHMPLPPYIASRRPPDVQDRTDYQTVYADRSGSVAAPTAGLHFSEALLARLAEKGVGRADITLHVGPGTFLPVTADDPAQHKMHPEWAEITEPAATRINQARKAGGRIAAVGTTALRTLESAVEPDGAVHAFEGETDIFITPGHVFRSAELLVTNFHLPGSTLFMLVCAFSGTAVMQRAYAEAIAAGYRFYSYGDACLLLRAR
jgi:S-adenosylmethionine:tRNA ribosyltransferase-isomerase